MKQVLINYYGVIILILFALFNIMLESLKFDGSLYILIMLLISILNILFMIVNKNAIKYKPYILTVFFLIMLSSNSIYHLIFALSTIIVLAIICFDENKFSRIVTILIFLWCIFVLPLLSLGLVFVYGSGKPTGTDDIYEIKSVSLF